VWYNKNNKTIKEKNMLEEYEKCKNDYIYFVEKYVKILDMEKGVVNFSLFDHQKEAHDIVERDRFLLGMWCRQSGKDIFECTYALYKALFNDNYIIGITSCKLDFAYGLLKYINFMYENLPDFLKCKIVKKTKNYLEFENGSKIIIGSSNKYGFRGISLSLLILNEFAFVKNKNIEEFFSNLMPVILGNIKKSKVIILSSKNYGSFFNELFYDEKSIFTKQNINWRKIPGRNEEWKNEMINIIGKDSFNQEYENI
jgi:Terminase large subunit, T4likevirus-type, N-terminal